MPNNTKLTNCSQLIPRMILRIRHLYPLTTPTSSEQTEGVSCGLGCFVMITGFFGIGVGYFVVIICAQDASEAEDAQGEGLTR